MHEQPESHKEIEKRILSTFAGVARSIGYSPLHGMIIGALLVKGRALSLQELADETGYSPSMVSLSLDLLEVLGTIKRVKKEADRKLYVALQGDLLESLKNAILIRVKKSIGNSLVEFQEAKERLKGVGPQEKENVENAIGILEAEIRRLEKYVNLLSGMRLP
ncbi:MAG: hypothetical protein HY367_00615 [Candidatus Aenigmarchaeota archaeon]|nr:hypothetical protein [Candidatus Aenigmarchaeota archaeon]